jgi:hypothetical protein
LTLLRQPQPLCANLPSHPNLFQPDRIPSSNSTHAPTQTFLTSSLESTGTLCLSLPRDILRITHSTEPSRQHPPKWLS